MDEDTSCTICCDSHNTKQTICIKNQCRYNICDACAIIWVKKNNSKCLICGCVTSFNTQSFCEKVTNHKRLIYDKFHFKEAHKLTGLIMSLFVRLKFELFSSIIFPYILMELFLTNTAIILACMYIFHNETIYLFKTYRPSVVTIIGTLCAVLVMFIVSSILITRGLQFNESTQKIMASYL